MASSRTVNTPGNYELEKKANKLQEQYFTVHDYWIPNKTILPGNGLLAGNVSREQLSYNSCDIESMLRGIGTTNLETSQPVIQPNIKYLQSLNIHDRIPLIIPSTLKLAPKPETSFAIIYS